MGTTDTSNAGSWDCHMLMVVGKSASTLGTSLALPTQAEYMHALGPGSSVPGLAPKLWVVGVRGSHTACLCPSSTVIPPTSDQWSHLGGVLDGVWVISQVCSLCEELPCCALMRVHSHKLAVLP